MRRMTSLFAAAALWMSAASSASAGAARPRFITAVEVWRYVDHAASSHDAPGHAAAPTGALQPGLASPARVVPSPARS
jgi:hypothetical protein